MAQEGDSLRFQLLIEYLPRPPNITGTLTRNGCPDPTGPHNITGTLTRNGRPGGLIREFIIISCKLVFAATGFFLAYYLTLLYYRRTPCCSHGSRRKDRPGDRESTVPESDV